MFKRNLVHVWVGIIILSGMFLMGQDTWPPSTGPTITSIDPPAAMAGEEVMIIGQEFGALQGSSFVTFSGVEAVEVSQWTDSQIKLTVPSGI